MRKAFLVKTYVKMTDLLLDHRCAHIFSKLTDNPNFPDSQPLLNELKIVSARYTAALTTSAEGGKADIVLKRQEKQNVVDALDKLKLSVENEAQHDRAILATSGFDISAESPAVLSLTAPEGFKLTDGLNTGEIKTSVKGVPQAVSYSHEYCFIPPDVTTNWIAKMTTLTEHTFTDLPAGTKIYCRVGAIGRKGQFAYTQVLSRIVQ